MLYLIEHGKALFWFFTFPFFSLILQQNLSKQAIRYISTIACVLILPILTSYYYIIPYFFEILGYIILSCFYASRTNISKITSVVKLSGGLFIFLGFFAILSKMAGFIVTEKEWVINNYKIEYRRDQGFTGGPLMKYELKKYGLVPIFIKNVETTIDDDTTQSCFVTFKESKVVFNKCEDKIIKNAP